MSRVYELVLSGRHCLCLRHGYDSGEQLCPDCARLDLECKSYDMCAKDTLHKTSGSRSSSLRHTACIEYEDRVVHTYKCIMLGMAESWTRVDMKMSYWKRPCSSKTSAAMQSERASA